MNKDDVFFNGVLLGGLLATIFGFFAFRRPQPTKVVFKNRLLPYGQISLASLN